MPGEERPASEETRLLREEVAAQKADKEERDKREALAEELKNRVSVAAIILTTALSFIGNVKGDRAEATGSARSSAGEARRQGFPATIVHPGHIVGPGWAPVNPCGHFEPLVFTHLAHGEELALPNLGMETVHHVHADDVAAIFMAALGSRSTALGESFHVVSPGCPKQIKPQIAAFDPTQLAQASAQGIHIGRGLVRATEPEPCDASHQFRALPARGERPSGRRAAEQDDELASLQLIEPHPRLHEPAMSTR